jgi:hypothetical protein
VAGWSAKERLSRERILSKYFVCMHENRIMKSAQIVLMGSGGPTTSNGG